MGKDTEHQQFAYSSQDAAIDDAHWRKQEASYDKQEANCKSQVENFHGESVSDSDSDGDSEGDGTKRQRALTLALTTCYRHR